MSHFSPDSHVRRGLSIPLTGNPLLDRAAAALSSIDFLRSWCTQHDLAAPAGLVSVPTGHPLAEYLYAVTGAKFVFDRNAQQIVLLPFVEGRMFSAPPWVEPFTEAVNRSGPFGQLVTYQQCIQVITRLCWLPTGEVCIDWDALTQCGWPPQQS
jgi:hypothetical protein